MPTQVVTGLAELEKQWAALKEDVAKKVMRNATAAGGRVFRDLMRQKAPRDQGDLAKGIQVSTRADVAHGRYTAKIRPSKRPPRGKPKEPSAASKALWSEYGVKPHFIKAKGRASGRDRNKALKLLGGLLVMKVDHPGIAPRPFMRPAADEGWPKAVQVFKDQLRAGLEKVASQRKKP